MSSKQQQTTLLPSGTLQRLTKEIKLLCTAPNEGITFLMNEQDISDIQAEISGPDGTPYEGGLFRCKLIITHEFPVAPPRAIFLTKIFHPNINSVNGEICVNTLKKDWTENSFKPH